MRVLYSKDGVIVRKSVIEDVHKLKNNLRKTDVAEIWASHNHTPEEALKLSFEQSVLCLTIENKDEVVAMFGIVPESLLGSRASIWLLGSDGIEDIQIKFLRNNGKFINFMLSFYPHLSNFVDSRNRVSINWLKKIGAKIHSAVNFGAEQLPFHYFEFERP